MSAKTIGILAGMGPRSTAPFVDLVITECQRQYGAQQDIDFPPLMIYSLPAPFYLDRPVDHQALEATISAGLQHLASTGVAFIAMPCNTAHMYYAQLAHKLQIPLLNMIDLTVQQVPPTTQRMALIATRTTQSAGLYQQAIQSSPVVLIADEAWQQRIDALIRTIKTEQDIPKAQRLWSDLIQVCESTGIDTVLIACTDITAAVTALRGNVAVLDATECLAATVVAHWSALG
ncbi:MAG: aspartate/glutamate racemase family protein [Chloroflexi bacterium]|nr:aspartate/glutamate racemase family protein [Chloroflexota bacterium]